MTEAGTGRLETPDGIALTTRRWPAADAWATMLIVHGLAEHSGRWGEVGTYFADRGIDVHAFDLRGHGRSEGKEQYVAEFDEYVDDVAFVAQTNVVPRGLPWVLYGHSMGGLIGTAYLLSDRPQPDAAILSAPALDSDVPAPLRAAAQVLGRIAGGVRMRNSIKPEHLSKDPEVGAAYLADPLVDLRTSARLGQQLLAAQGRCRAGADQLTIPAFVIHGADDELVPPRASAPLAASESVERKLYPGLRHEVHNEPEAAECLDDVLAFLERTLGS